MGEVLSEDVLDWARDLAAINKLLAGEQIERSQPRGSAKILNFPARSVGFSSPQRRNSPICRDGSGLA